MAVPIFMVITGYVSTLSFERKGLSFSFCYKPIEMIKKWLRFIIPFLPAWILTVIARIIGREEVFSFGLILLDFLTGGIGCGSYYFPVMIQVVLLMPLIWYIIKLNPLIGLLICFGVNILFETLKTFMNMSPELYRICSFRYIFILGYGCFLFNKQHDIKKHFLYYLVGIVGVVYIIVFNYTELKPIITDQWTATSVFATLYLVPIMMILFSKTTVRSELLELLGKASFNIFVVQMIFYLGGDKIVCRFIPYKTIQLPVITIICCFIGVLYYKIESPITQRIIKKIS